MEKVSSRTERQLEIVQKFADNKGRGTLLAATGFGKTFTAVMVILRMIKSRPDCKIIVVVPTINLKNQDPKCDLDYTANIARDCRIDFVMNNSFGFGGTNASLLLGKLQ